MVAALVFQLWRSSWLEAQLVATETERAQLLGERILQRAGQSERVFAAVPAERRFVVRGDRVVIDEQIAWLQPVARSAEEDLIVQDRLERAAQAEFVANDHAAAEKEFDELLAGPLLPAHRLQVLSAALWHARRLQAAVRCSELAPKFLAALAEVKPAQLGSMLVASAVASAWRLSTGPQSYALRVDNMQDLLPFLPELQFAGLGATTDKATVARHRDVVWRRRRMAQAEQWFTRMGLAQPATIPADGLHVLGPDLLLWLMSEQDGVRQAAVLSPVQWFAAVLQEAGEGASFQWPERIEPEFAAVDQVAFAAVPGIVRLRPVQTTQLGASVWLLPALTSLLAFAFALAFVQQRRAARRESQANALQAQFLTTVTHELKTPLAGIRLLGEMLAEGRALGKEDEYYRLLVGEAARLSLLIDNVLDLGRLERGERRYSLSPQPLADVVRETLRMFVPVLEQNGITVTFEDALLDASANLDRDAFVQSLIVVLDNARKYGAVGKRVEVLGVPHGEQLLLSVRDYGPGVASEEQEAIFDRFVRGRDHRHGSTPGVGIGLYLARSIVRRLGGDLVCVAPAHGEGAEFRFLLQRGNPT